MARQELIGDEKASIFRGKLEHNFEELYSGFVARQGWGYQDFPAGTLGSSAILTANTNGLNILFDSSKVVGSTAAICLVSNNLQIPYTGSLTLFSSKVGVTANVGNSVTLSGVPHVSWGACRIFYLYNYDGPLPEGNILAPKFISEKILTALDTTFITDDTLPDLIEAHIFETLDANTIKLDNTELLLDGFKSGSVGAPGTIPYSNGVDQQLSWGTPKQIIGDTETLAIAYAIAL